jgi:hypothetical protein
MTLPTNDDFAIRELSIEELEAIAAGSVWGWIKHEAGVIEHGASAAGSWLVGQNWQNVAGAIVGAAVGALFGYAGDRISRSQN